MFTNVRKFFSRKWVRIVIIITVVYLVYTATLQPLVRALTCYPIVSSGVALYSDDKYLEFDKGDVFQAALETLPIPADAIVCHFEYYNHPLRDNLFYGKFPDVYILELDLGSQYDAFKEYTIQNSGDCYSENGVELHWLQNAVTTDEDCFHIALYEEAHFARCILVTEQENAIGGALAMGSSLFMMYGIDLFGRIN